MLKTLIVYTHLIAACLAIGILLLQDLAIAKTKGKALSRKATQDLAHAADVMFMALIALWISGLALVIIGYLNDANYIYNEKLWAKFSVVAVLTLNGILLHYFSFPRVISAEGLVGQGAFEQIAVVLTGAVSSTSWLFACFLGIARPWNHTMDYSLVMSIYGALLIGASLFAMEVLRTIRKEGYLVERPILLNRTQQAMD
jgi:uncharacterized membrane protein